MASSGNSSTKKTTILDCPICLEELKGPRYLQCKHTYCETCLTTYIGGTFKISMKGGMSFCCPVCRKSFSLPEHRTSIEKWVLTLPKNQIILALMKNEKSKSKVTYNCDPCERIEDDVKASHWCCDCSELYCSNCLKNFHKRVKNVDGHTIIDISETFSFQDFKEGTKSDFLEPCQKHKNKNYEAFCFSHFEFCCVFCLVYNHRNCSDIRTLDEVTNAFSVDRHVNVAYGHLTRIGELLLKTIEIEKNQIVVIEKEATQKVSEAEKDIDLAITRLIDMKSNIKRKVSEVCDSATTPFKQNIAYLEPLHGCITKEREELAVVKQQKDARLQLFALLKTQKSFENYQTTFKKVTQEEAIGIDLTISLAPDLIEYVRGRGHCFDVSKVPLKNVWEDISKQHITKEFNVLNNYFVSMIKCDDGIVSGDNVFLDDTDTADDEIRRNSLEGEKFGFYTMDNEIIGRSYLSDQESEDNKTLGFPCCQDDETQSDFLEPYEEHTGQYNEEFCVDSDSDEILEPIERKSSKSKNKQKLRKKEERKRQRKKRLGMQEL